MTVVALVLLPFVLGYQAWTYYVFRRRISDQQFRPAARRAATAVPVAQAAPAPGARPAAQRHGWVLPRGWRRPRGPRT
jgi:hypothetical protein